MHGLSTPTLKLINPKLDGSNGEQESWDFNGNRTTKGLKSFLYRKMPGYSHRITLGETHMAEVQAHAEQYSLPVAMWFTHQSETIGVIKSLSSEFRRRILIVEIESTETNQGILAQYGFSNSSLLPEILIFPANVGWSRESAIRYEEDKFTLPMLTEFISHHVVPDRATLNTDTAEQPAHNGDSEVVVTIPVADRKRDLHDIDPPSVVDATCASI
jgi:hypothetical protein